MSYVCRKINTSVLHPISNEMIQLNKASYNHECISSKASHSKMLAPLSYLLVDMLAKKVSVWFYRMALLKKSQRGRRINIEAIVVSV